MCVAWSLTLNAAQDYIILGPLVCGVGMVRVRLGTLGNSSTDFELKNLFKPTSTLLSVTSAYNIHATIKYYVYSCLYHVQKHTINKKVKKKGIIYKLKNTLYDRYVCRCMYLNCIYICHVWMTKSIFKYQKIYSYFMCKCGAVEEC